MKLIRNLLLGSVFLAAPALFSVDASAGGGAGAPTTTHAQTGISLFFLTLSQALHLGINLHSSPVDIGSDACGALKVTTASTCNVALDAACLSGCKASNFTLAAYSECAGACAQTGSEICKLSCNPTCKAVCAGDCDFDAVMACEANCQKGCGSKCALKAAQEGIDPAECDLACDTTCSSKCSAASVVDGIENCGVQCGSSCQAQCNAEAVMGCQITCQVALFEEKALSCAEGCAESGSLYCDGQYVEVDSLEECVDALLAVGIPVKS